MIQNQIQDILSHFKGISLKEIDAVKLMTRSDVKYVCHIDQLPGILESAMPDYQVLENHEKKLLGYESLYFDTPGNSMYLRHHNRKRNRYKIRVREYTESHEFFLEIKFKSNTGVTEKKRIPISAERNLYHPEAFEFLTENSAFSPDQLEPRLFSSFRRMTLVNIPLVERITIDIFPAWFVDESRIELPYLVIIELKKDKFNNNEGFGRILRDARIPRKRLSKYCTGINLLYPSVKYNRFKAKMLHLKKLDKSLEYAHHFKSFS